MAAASLGPDKLGFTPDEISLHSARSGAACEDIHVMWEDATGFGTSFQNQLPRILLATALGG